jgi:hypothetical protein
MEFQDVILLLHPAIAIIVVFPLLGVVVNRALSRVLHERENSVGIRSD